METQLVRLDQLRGPLVAGLLWSAFALGSAYLRDAGGAVLLIWLPSAVAVASLYATPPRRWPVLLGTLFAFQLLTFAWLGIAPLTSLGFAFAGQVEALVSAGIGLHVLGGRGKGPQTFTHVAGLFVAAIVGCLAGALLALPFRAEPGMAEFAWWFLASVLGVLTATPVLLYQRQ